jgi:hypothetical protein
VGGEALSFPGSFPLSKLHNPFSPFSKKNACHMDDLEAHTNSKKGTRRHVPAHLCVSLRLSSTSQTMVRNSLITDSH